MIKDQNFNLVIDAIKKAMDFNPDHYKYRPLRRRIWSRMRRLGIDSYEEYSNLLLNDEEEAVCLQESLTINLTRFFRNKVVFEYVKNEILPSTNTPFIWSAGCSSGAEPYTLAILCNESGLNCTITGTDIDKASLGKAKIGIYSSSALTETDPVIRNKYFEKVGNQYKIIDGIREAVKFQQVDLKDIDYKEEFDLIICRNVLIYLEREFQVQTLLGFHKALKDGGNLILGKVESLVGRAKSMFKPINLTERIYEKSK